MPEDRYNRFRISIEAYYREHKRDLPWRREVPVAYEVWLSEIIMQQTRVAQGTPYFLRIREAFPDVKSLAEAPEDRLLALWTGLGYYNRARNLQRGAMQVMEEFGGELPRTYAELLRVRGIGPYTAAAISSICFGEKKGVVDGNVYRVLSRYFGIDTPINSSQGQKVFQALADACVTTSERPGDFNQGMMEFGALHCTPKKPGCMLCPLADQCEALAAGRVAELPVKLKKGKRGVEHIHYAVAELHGRHALVRRGTEGIWAGLYEFPRLEGPPEQGLAWAPPIVHKLSHKDLHCHFWSVDPTEVGEEAVYYERAELTRIGLPIIIADALKRTDES